MSTAKLGTKIELLGLRGYPTCATVELTYRCNAACPYCYVKNRDKSELSTAHVKLVIDKLDRSGILTLVFTGGEPFLRADILDILEYAAQKNFFEILIFTNGTLLTQEHISFLIKHKDRLSHFQMSVFSHRPEVNDRVFGIPGAQQTFMRNAELLKVEGIRVHFSLSVFDFNIDSFQETLDYFKTRGFPIFHSVLKFEATPEQERAIAGSTSKDFFKAYFAAYPHDGYIPYMNEIKRMLTLPVLPTGPCHGIAIGINVNPHGDVTPCLSFGPLTYGNMLEKGELRDILMNSELYQSLIKNGCIPEKCSTCSLVNICQPCPARMHLKTGNLGMVDEQQCAFAHALHEEAVCLKM